jgi:hypothetical protein
MRRDKLPYMTTILEKFLSPADRDQVRQIVVKDSEPIAPFWLMRTLVAQNPIHGLEYLPFDQAVRKGLEWELSGGGATKQFRQDLSEESQKKIIEQTIAVAWISINLCLIQRLQLILIGLYHADS